MGSEITAGQWFCQFCSAARPHLPGACSRCCLACQSRCYLLRCGGYCCCRRCQPLSLCSNFSSTPDTGLAAGLLAKRFRHVRAKPDTDGADLSSCHACCCLPAARVHSPASTQGRCKSPHSYNAPSVHQLHAGCADGRRLQCRASSCLKMCVCLGSGGRRTACPSPEGPRVFTHICSCARCTRAGVDACLAMHLCLWPDARALAAGHSLPSLPRRMRK